MNAPTERVVKSLFALSGNRCAFPQCSTAIVQRESETITGKICHIKARSPKGQRYDPQQTDQERHGFSNLILLCGVHHDIVDSPSENYTVETLIEMKRKREICGNNELSKDDSRIACKLRDSYLRTVVDVQSQAILNSPGATQQKKVSNKKSTKKTSLSQTSFGPGAVNIGRDQNNYIVDKINRGGRATPPPDAVTESQAANIKQMISEVIELDSASPSGSRLSEGELHKKWWGALYAKVRCTTYLNYSQAKYKQAIKWLQEQRARLHAGSEIEPELPRAARIRAIQTYISRNKIDKHAYYIDLSKRLGISPPFQSSTDLSDRDIGRVYQAVLRDSKKH